MYALTVGREDVALDRLTFAAALAMRGIDTRTFFCPMNQQPALQRLPGFRATPCPVAERGWTRGAYLPSSPGLTDAELSEVALAVREVMASA